MLKGLFFLLMCSVASAASLPILDLQGGVTFSEISTPTDVSSSQIAGFNAGVAMEFPLGPQAFVRPELTFAQRGAALVDAGGVKMTAKSNALEVPVLFGVKFGEVIRPFVFAGPAAIFNISNSLSVDTPGSQTSVSYNPRTVDFAAVAGLGVDFGPVFLAGRYQWGILELNRDRAEWRARSIQILLGIKLG